MESVKTYLSTLGCVWSVAHHDLRRGGDREVRPLETGSAAGSYQSEEEGATIGNRRPIMEGAPPRYSPAAMALLKAEERQLKQREKALMSKHRERDAQRVQARLRTRPRSQRPGRRRSRVQGWEACSSQRTSRRALRPGEEAQPADVGM
jgi:hypothetical protein